MIHTNFLRFARRKYFWWSLAIMVAALVLYGTQSAERPKSGHTWQGYVLGTAGVLLILWLSLLAVRKRRYSSRTGTVKGWTSAHIYLGIALLLVATLHCAFQFGSNVHTLAYVLMCLVIGSGMFGLYVYIALPALVATNREGATREELFGELFDLDQQVQASAERCAPAMQTAVDSSIERTTIGGGAWAQLFRGDRSRFLRSDESGGPPVLVRNRDQRAVIAFLARQIPRADKSDETALLQQLLLLLSRRQVILRRLRLDIRLQGWLKLWLYLHVRMTLALMAALAIHIAVVFIYW
jgi:hypothetical protein